MIIYIRKRKNCKIGSIVYRYFLQCYFTPYIWCVVLKYYVWVGDVRLDKKQEHVGILRIITSEIVSMKIIRLSIRMVSHYIYLFHYPVNIYLLCHVSGWTLSNVLQLNDKNSNSVVYEHSRATWIKLHFRIWCNINSTWMIIFWCCAILLRSNEMFITCLGLISISMYL